MSTPVSNPNTLTKERLKNELQKFNIPLPPSASKKDVYVELYRTHLLKDRVEFSSDDETVSATPKRTKKPASPKKKSTKKKQAEPVKMEQTAEVNVLELSDEELAQRLQDLGVEIGPILDTTRKVYQWKLQRLLHQAVQAEPLYPPADDSSQDEFSDNDELEMKRMAEEAEARVVPPLVLEQNTALKKRPVQQKTRPSRPAPVQEKEREEDQVDSNAVPAKTHVNNITTQVAPPAAPATKSRRGLSMWAQLAILVVVAAILFFVIQNMEPAKISKVGQVAGSK